MLETWLAAIEGARHPLVKHCIAFVGEDPPEDMTTRLTAANIRATVHRDAPGRRSIAHYHNLMIRSAETEWVMKLDVDCMTHQGFFKALCGVLARAEEGDWFNCGMLYVNQDVSQKVLVPERMPLTESACMGLVTAGKRVSSFLSGKLGGSNFICRKDDYLRSGGGDGRFRGWGWEDYQQMYMLELGRLGRCPLPGRVDITNVSNRCRDEICLPKIAELRIIDPSAVLLHKWHAAAKGTDYRSYSAANKEVLLSYINEHGKKKRSTTRSPVARRTATKAAGSMTLRKWIRTLRPPVSVIGNGPLAGRLDLGSGSVIRLNNFRFSPESGDLVTHWVSSGYKNVEVKDFPFVLIPWNHAMLDDGAPTFASPFPGKIVTTDDNDHILKFFPQARKGFPYFPSTGFNLMALLHRFGIPVRWAGFNGLRGGHHLDPTHVHDHRRTRDAEFELIRRWFRPVPVVRQTAKGPRASDHYTRGDVICLVREGDRNDVDFYQVVRVKTREVVLRPIDRQAVDYSLFDDGAWLPVEGEFRGREMLRKSVDSDGGMRFSQGRASKWYGSEIRTDAGKKFSGQNMKLRESVCYK